MANQPKRSSDSPKQTSMQIGEGLQIDYSYTQWRYAQMQQLESNYTAQCERELQLAEAAE